MDSLGEGIEGCGEDNGGEEVEEGNEGAKDKEGDGDKAGDGDNPLRRSFPPTSLDCFQADLICGLSPRE